AFGGDAAVDRGQADATAYFDEQGIERSEAQALPLGPGFLPDQGLAIDARTVLQQAGYVARPPGGGVDFAGALARRGQRKHRARGGTAVHPGDSVISRAAETLH